MDAGQIVVGFEVGIGFTLAIVTVLTIALGIGLAVSGSVVRVLRRRLERRRTVEERKMFSRADALTDKQIGQRVISAAMNLDLWTRTATIRNIPVKPTLVTVTDRPDIFPHGRRIFEVEVEVDGEKVRWPPRIQMTADVNRWDV